MFDFKRSYLCVRQTDRRTDRLMGRGWERWYHMTLKTSNSPISFPDWRQLGPKQADRHAGWNFPITQAWKDIHLVLFKTVKINTEFQTIKAKHITLCLLPCMSCLTAQSTYQIDWFEVCVVDVETVWITLMKLCSVLPCSDPGWGGAAARRLSSPGLPLHEESDGIALPCTREDYQSEDLPAWCRKWGQKPTTYAFYSHYTHQIKSSTLLSQ